MNSSSSTADIGLDGSGVISTGKLLAFGFPPWKGFLGNQGTVQNIQRKPNEKLMVAENGDVDAIQWNLSNAAPPLR